MKKTFTLTLRQCFGICFWALVGGFVLMSCANNVKNGQKGLDSLNKAGNLDKAYEKAKIIFYSLPSPIETAMVLEEAGVAYNEDILNPIQNVSNYNTNRSMALNLGVYSADLSYASLFDQPQSTVNYLSVSKTLAQQLGVLEAINDSVITLLKSNIKNKNEMMTIISETFMKSSSYLLENDRAEISSMVVLGGWMEALYISVQLARKSPKKNKALIETIIDQNLSLEDLLGLLELYKDNKDVAGLVVDIKELQNHYQNLNSNNFSQEKFDKLCDKVEAIRNGYTK